MSNSYSPWATVALAAAPPWPPLSVADSTTQWLPLLKQSRFLPLASARIHFSHVPALPARCPPLPRTQGTLRAARAAGTDSCSWQCSAGSLTEGPALFPAMGQRDRHPCASPWSCCSPGSCAPALLPAQQCLAKRGTLKLTENASFRNISRGVPPAATQIPSALVFVQM